MRCVYSALLVWAVVRKMEQGMDADEVYRVYGIPSETARRWAEAMEAGE